MDEGEDEEDTRDVAEAIASLAGDDFGFGDQDGEDA
jgi:hypothetical protein